MLETWALEIVAAFAAVQLLALAYFYYRGLTGTTNGDSQGLAPAAPDDGDRDAVQCSECGAENDPGYRYCRDCVADLSGESIPGYRIHSPSERSL